MICSCFKMQSVTVVNNTLLNGTATAGTTTISTPSLHDLQLYSVIVTIVLFFIVFGGVKIINKVALAFLIPIPFSLLCIYLRVFIAPSHNAPCKYLIAGFIMFFVIMC
jgi:solute carrier family 12 (potassium/chloride transporter), member 4/6